MFQEIVGKRRESDALHNLRASDEFSKLMKDRNFEFFETGLKGVNTLREFDDSIRKGNLRSMTRFWQSYLDMVDILFDFCKIYSPAILGFAFEKHRKNALMDPCLRPYELLEAFRLLLSESAKTCNKASFNISRISGMEFCC